MIQIDQKDLRLIREILNRYLPDGQAWAFGSRVNGGFKPYSDLDILLQGTGKLDISVTNRMIEAFQDCPLTFRVELLDAARVDEGFLKQIENHKERIFPA